MGTRRRVDSRERIAVIQDMFIAGSMLIMVAFCCVAALRWQRAQHAHEDKHRTWQDNTALSVQLVTEIAKIDELKKRVDSLILRSGLKL